jgi:hypothetical protein
LTFSDGEKVWAWNRYAWTALALPATFLLFHVIVNRSGDVGEVSSNKGVIGLLIFAAVLSIVAFAFWLFFKLRFGNEEEPA